MGCPSPHDAQTLVRRSKKKGSPPIFFYFVYAFLLTFIATGNGWYIVVWILSCLTVISPAYSAIIGIFDISQNLAWRANAFFLSHCLSKDFSHPHWHLTQGVFEWMTLVLLFLGIVIGFVFFIMVSYLLPSQLSFEKRSILLAVHYRATLRRSKKRGVWGGILPPLVCFFD